MRRAIILLAALAACGDDPPPAPVPPPPVPPSDRPLAGGPPASVSLSIEDDCDPVEPGDRVTLTIRLANQHRIDDVVSPALLYELPAGFEFVSSIPDAPYDPRTRTVRFESPRIAPGGSGEMMRVVTVRAMQPGWAVHRVAAELGGQPGVIESMEPTNVAAGPAPALSFELADEKDPVRVGGELRATLTVRNPGTAPLRSVALFIEPPFGGAPVAATYDSIEPGASKTLAAKAAATAAGFHRFRASVTVAGVDGVFRDEEPVLVID